MKFVARNVLAGRAPLFNYDKEFKVKYNQTVASDSNIYGHTFEEMQECYDYLNSVCDKLAFSFESWWFDYAKENNIPLANIRYEIINHLNINTNKPHHLLGCILPNEFKLWKDTTWIETIDTSAPITNAIEGKEIQSEMTEKPKTTIHGSFYMDYLKEVTHLMNKNAELFKQYYIF